MKHKIVLLLLTLALGLPLLAQQSGNMVPSDASMVAELLTDTYKGETILLVRILEDVKLDATLYVQDRNGTRSDQVEVMHVLGSYIILKDKLPRDHLVGAKIYQR